MGEAELPCTVMELVRKAVVSSLVVLGCLVVRFVAGELGMAVTPRVDGMRLGVGTWVVRDVDWEVVDWEDGVEEAGVLAVVRDVEETAVVLEAGMCDGVGDMCRGGVIDADEGCKVGVSGGEREDVWGVETAVGKEGVDRGAVFETVGCPEEEEVRMPELKAGDWEVEAAEDNGEGGKDCLVEVDVWEAP